MKPCNCFRCTSERVRSEPLLPEETFAGYPLALMKMFLCETCGNKRCPHATWHGLDCTGSNEPGQAGSNYE